jgi:hypothetical protein
MAPSKRTVAIHEAGHIVAACRLLRGITEAGLGGHKKVGTVADYAILRGGYRHHEWRAGKEVRTRVTGKNRARLAEHAFRAIVVSFAGPMAHARHTHRSFDAVLETYGTNDHEQIKGIACHVHGGEVWEFIGGFNLFGKSSRQFRLSDDANAVVARGADYTRQLVADDWRLIERIGTKLLRAGRIEHDDPLLAKIPRITGPLFRRLTPTPVSGDGPELYDKRGFGPPSRSCT